MDTMRWTGSYAGLLLLDQRKLPHTTEYLTCSESSRVAEAIRDMAVRGAPAIGVAAAYGMALAAAESIGQGARWRETLARKADGIRTARPTAVSLAAAVDRMMARASALTPETLVDGMLAEAKDMQREDEACCLAIGGYGQELLGDGDRVLTHCNAGALATTGIGTALGVIRAAAARGKSVSVWAGETRPYLQGSRLTALELMDDGIPVTIICDNMAGFMMQSGRVDKVIVGADRIAANGDTANKIGTYPLAVLARHHGIPFYVAAPVTTIDPSIRDGTGIPIEFRNGAEITCFMGAAVAPDGAAAENPAFDVTPAELIDAIVTDRGILQPPYAGSIKNAL